jgi:hypothetical protein
MARREPIFDWEIEDADATEAVGSEQWAVDSEPPVERRLPLPNPRSLTPLLRGALGLVVLAAAILVLAAWQRARDNVVLVRGDIEGMIVLEGRAWVAGDDELRRNLIDANAESTWRYRFERVESRYRRWSGEDAQTPQVEVRGLELLGDVALVQAVVTQTNANWAPSPYRETRFYRNVEGRWLRTGPDASFWGAEQTANTAHFHFKYYERDAEAVQALAAQAEALYAQLRADAGLPPEPPEGSEGLATTAMTIEVLPRMDLTSWRFMGDVLTIPSPALLPVPIGHPDSDRLARSLVRPLGARVLEEALAETSIQPGWRPLVDGMARWASWQAGPLPSPWEMHMGDHLRDHLASRQPPTLYALTGPMPATLDRWTAAKAAETVIDFVVATYGRETLPVLLRGFAEHRTWDTLIPTVFGVPREAFEARWQRFILVYYGPPVLDAASEARRFVNGE